MTVLKCIIASLIMLCAVEALNFVIPAGGGILMRAVRLFVPVGAGLLVYYIMAVILKINPVVDFTGKILKRGKI